MIGSSENRVSYNGNGIATEFAYTFKILEKSNLKVLHVAADGTEELLTTDYYVDMEKSVVLYPGYAPGAEIPEQNRPPILPVGERLVLYREVPITQESALDKHWPFNVIENGLDKLTIICQQIWDRLQRSFYVSESTSTNFDPKVPIEAGKTFRVKDDGTGFEVTEDPGKVIDGATALLKQTTEQAEFAKEQADASSQSAVNAQNAANAAEKIATDLGLVDEAVQMAVSSAEQASNNATTASNKADVATAKADIATTKASEASASADTATEQASIATAKADAANTSATNAAQSYANADAVATQLTEYLATKESLTAPTVDKTLLIEGAAADAKVVGELKSDLTNTLSDFDIGHLPIVNEFSIGSIGNTGNCSYDNTKLNVISRTALYFSRAIRLNVKSGFRFVIHYYSSATMNSTTWEQEKYSGAWNTTYIDIPADQYFNIVINKTGNTDTPNVDEFVDAIYITTAFQSQINQNTRDISDLQGAVTTVAELEEEIKSLRNDYVKSLPFEIGGHTQNPWSITTNLSRITTSNIIDHTYSRATITCDEGYELYLTYYRDDNTFVSNSGWVTSITLLDNRKFAFTVRKATNEINISSVDDLLVHIHSDSYVGIISDLEKEVQQGKPFPDYVDAECNRVLTECYSKFTFAPIVFGFNTDQHITYNSSLSNRVIYGLRALSKITKFIPFNFVALGGDAAGYDYESGGVDSTQQGIIEDVTAAMEPLYDAWCPVVSITGNHDAYQNAAGQTDPITYQQIFQTYMKRAVISKQLYNRDTVSTDCYIDDATCNIRFIFIDDTDSADTNYNDRVRVWLTEALSTLVENYDAIIISHRPQNSNLGEDFIGARSNQDILSQYANRIICCVNGHAHKDGAQYLDGIMYIETTCAMAGQNSTDGHTRTLGAATETAFDIYMVDKTEKKIYTVRYGAGISREFIYDGSNAGQVIT